MDSDGRIRASDSDRERVVEILRGGYTEGRLTLDEFNERMTAAYAAKTWSQLRELTSDLPVEVNLRRPPGSAVGPPGRDRAALQPPPGSQPLPTGRPGFFPVLPFVILFIVLAGSAHAAALAVLPAVVILMVWLRASSRNRPGRGQRPGGGFPPGPGSGRA